MVISAAIDKYIYISINRTFTDDYFLKYSQLERVPNPDHDRAPDRPRGAARPRRRPRRGDRLDRRHPVRHRPGLLRVVHGRPAQGGPRDAARPRLGRRPRRREACEIEIERLGPPVGKQDQYIAAFGGITRFDFNPDGSVDVAPARLSPRHHARPRGAPADVLHRLLAGRRRGARGAGHQVDRRRPGDDRQPPLRQGPRPAPARRAREGRRLGLRRPHARALAEQEEAVELDVEPQRSTRCTTLGRERRSARRQAGRRRRRRLPDVLRGGHRGGCARRCARRASPSCGSGSTRPAARCSSASERSRRAVRRSWPAASARGCGRTAQTVPKTLLPVAGRPFADWQLGWLARGGRRRRSSTASATSASRCADHVGDGSSRGDWRSSYVDEGDAAARHRRAHCGWRSTSGVLAERFLVLYGDSWLQVDPAAVYAAAERADAPALMTVYENNGRFDASNVVYAEGPGASATRRGCDPLPPEMRWIDYGLSVLTRRPWPNGSHREPSHDLAALFTALSARGELAGLPGGPSGSTRSGPRRAWPRSPTSSPAEADLPQVVVANCGSGASASLNNSRCPLMLCTRRPASRSEANSSRPRVATPSHWNEP